MFIKESQCIYPSYARLLSKADRTGHYPGPEGIKQIIERSNPSDRLLYTQSNGRTLIGQDEQGRLHMAVTPQDHDYPLPALSARPDQRVRGYPGMFYQADVAMLWGKLHFELTLADGSVLTAGAEGGQCCYLDGFLPATFAQAGPLKLTAMSLAPVLEPEAVSAIPGLPLPGPSAAMHVLYVENTSDHPVSGQAQLIFAQQFITQYEDDGEPLEQRARRPYQAEWEGNMLVLWRPDACAAIQAEGFQRSGNPGAPTVWKDILIPPGGTCELTCFLAVTTAIDKLRPALACLYTHSMLEWINITAGFWKARLGSLSGPEGDVLAGRSTEFIRRSILDNFNCLQMNDDGEMVANWQGAPSHHCARLWGIDAEPTAISVMYALPEMGPILIRYIASRNRPRYPYYPDHSTPNMMAPLVIAAQYLELTGDVECFRRDEATLALLRGTADELLTLRHPDGLIHSHYSSDGHVFNRYDHGTNAKGFRALSGFAGILEALGEDGAPYREAAARIAAQIEAQMVTPGPFGPQIKGGVNLGEDDPFYLRGDLLYYDGEDSSSCLAPLYGVYGFDSEAWRNYHRFARSLWCSNYDPELDVLRWFAWGGPVAGTALLSAVGGSVTRGEMRRGLHNMMELGLDETGSLFWWSRGINCVRWLTRCSQGQGSWVYQHTEQWLGLRLNALEGTLDICPQGMYGAYRWEGARLGAFTGDIAWEEGEQGARLTLSNRSALTLTVRCALRPRGAGLGDGFERREYQLSPGMVLEAEIPYPAGNFAAPEPVEAVESRAFAASGPAFGPQGFALINMEQQGRGVSLLRYAVLAGDEPLGDAELTLTVPEGFLIKTKAPRMWEIMNPDAPGTAPTATFTLGDIGSGERACAVFCLERPAECAASPVWLRGNPFSALRSGEARLLIGGGKAAGLGNIRAALRGRRADGRAYEAVSELPIRVLSGEDFTRAIGDIFGSVHPPMPSRL